MENYVNLSSTASFELREALLVYSSDRTGNRSDSISFVTKHGVKIDAKGVPSLLPGAPIGRRTYLLSLSRFAGRSRASFCQRTS